MPEKAKWTAWHTLSLLSIVVAILLIGWLAPNERRALAWLGTLLLLAILGGVIGHGVTNLWRGILIDERNMMSLSRFQMTLWTLLILSAFLISVIYNVKNLQEDPVAIALPETLWLLMGISTASLIGSPLIRSNKMNKPVNELDMARSLNLLFSQGVDPSKIINRGQVIINPAPKDSQWSDLFRGEEPGNVAQIDLSKVQNFLFTLILLLAYGFTLGSMFAGDTGKIAAFPGLDTGMVALLGISHAGYLASKAFTHTPPSS
jgi:hypothetical protein